MESSGFSVFIIIIALFMGLLLLLRSKELNHKLKNRKNINKIKVPDYGLDHMRITFALGSCWYGEEVFHNVTGVIDVVSGYAGGIEPYPTWYQVKRGDTSHRMAVQVIYNPTIISISELYDIFRSSIDPTDEDGQFTDRGFQFTTAIFYHTNQQFTAAEISFEHQDSSGRFGKPIVTEILPYTTFFLAEEEYQNCYLKESELYTRYKHGSGRKRFFDGLQSNHIESISSTSPSSEMKPIMKPLEEIHHRSGAFGLLTDEQIQITQQCSTELPFENEYRNTYEDGIYVDIVSGLPLFSSQDKFASGSGWPSFSQTLVSSNITEHVDTSHDMIRTEIKSASGSHLGHIFSDGPISTGGQRYCVNSASLKFISKDQLNDMGYAEWGGLFK